MKKIIKKSLVLFLAISGIQAMDGNQTDTGLYYQQILDSNNNLAIGKDLKAYELNNQFKKEFNFLNSLPGFQENENQYLFLDLFVQLNTMNNAYDSLITNIDQYNSEEILKIITDEQFSGNLLLMTYESTQDICFTQKDIENFLEDKKKDLEKQINNQNNNQKNQAVNNNISIIEEDLNQGNAIDNHQLPEQKITDPQAQAKKKDPSIIANLRQYNLLMLLNLAKDSVITYGESTKIKGWHRLFLIYFDDEIEQILIKNSHGIDQISNDILKGIFNNIHIKIKEKLCYKNLYNDKYYNYITPNNNLQPINQEWLKAFLKATLQEKNNLTESIQNMKKWEVKRKQYNLQKRQKAIAKQKTQKK
jgi:hypothetical protein